MKKRAILSAVCLCLMFPALGAAKPKPEPKARPATHKTATVRGRGSRSSRSKPRAAVVRRSSQQAPSAQRYRDIQQALADKGYYHGELNGAWGQDSSAALKRFQKDQNLTDTGKLDSLSIIALGLGPKRNLNARSTTELRPKDENRRPEGSQGP